MDIKQIKYFITIVDHGTYSHASRSLFITQPTLSQAIKKLESEVGGPLFIQHKNGLTLTTSGQLLYEEGRKIIQQFDALTEQLKILQQPPKENIRVGLPTLFAMEMMPIFSKFMFAHPTVELTLVQGGSYELQQQLAQGDIDLGILSFPKFESSIVLHPFQNHFTGYHASIVMTSDHPLATRETVTFDDIAEYPFSTLSPRFMLGRLLYSRSRECGYVPSVVYTDDNWEVVLSSVKTFGSVCIMATEYQSYYSDTSLVWVPLQDRKAFFPVGVAYREQDAHTSAVDELITLLQQL